MCLPALSVESVTHLRIWKNLRPLRAEAANIWLLGPERTMVEAHIVIISGKERGGMK